MTPPTTDPAAEGMAAQAWPDEWEADMAFETTGMLRSRANIIEDAAAKINKNVLGERTLGLPREPDPWHGAGWQETPRS